MIKLEIRRPDDETLEVWLDGELITWANHGEHGWSGMDAVEKCAVGIARALAIPVEGSTP